MAELPTDAGLARGTRIELIVTGILAVTSILTMVFDYMEKQRKEPEIWPLPIKKKKSRIMQRRHQLRCHRLIEMDRLRKLLEHYDHDFGNTYYGRKFPDKYYDHDEETEEEVFDYSQNSVAYKPTQNWVGIPTPLLAAFFILKVAYLIIYPY